MKKVGTQGLGRWTQARLAGAQNLAAVLMRRRFGLCLQAFALGMTWPYFNLVNRIRSWGRLPKERGSTLVICNHQHDLDTSVIVSKLILDGPWCEAVYLAG